MNFIRQYWFGLITGTFVFVFLALFILILLSPRQDIQKRGFIPCTEMMADNMLSCEGKVFCLLSAIVKNSWCDMKVVGRGMASWVKGEQRTPWENYIFIPELPTDEDFDADARAEYLKTSPNIEEEMQRLHELNKELENAEINEQEVSWEQHPQGLPKE